VNAPALTIVIELEAPVRLRPDCLNSGEEDRLYDWIAASPSIAGLVVCARELAAEEPAA
jgi:hypothetical protein